MRHYFPLGTMLWLILQMFYMACSCIVEERIALMRVRSSFVEANSEFPESWGQSDDCCSWEGVGCNSNSRVSDLNLECKYIPLSDSDDEGGCIWNMNLTMFSPFHELQLLELSENSAYLKSSEGLQGLTKLRYLYLNDNCLIGDNILESLGELASLETIHFESCGMSGDLQSSAFGKLKNLEN